MRAPGGWHVGDAPYGPMVAAAGARGLELSGLRAQQFAAGDFGRFDLILAMDRTNLRDIEGLRPAGDVTPVRLFTSYLAGAAADVPDPYYTQDFEGALDLVQACAAALDGSI